jgi:hypothetical protein
MKRLGCFGFCFDLFLRYLLFAANLDLFFVFFVLQFVCVVG